MKEKKRVKNINGLRDCDPVAGVKKLEYLTREQLYCLWMEYLNSFLDTKYVKISELPEDEKKSFEKILEKVSKISEPHKIISNEIKALIFLYNLYKGLDKDLKLQLERILGAEEVNVFFEILKNEEYERALEKNKIDLLNKLYKEYFNYKREGINLETKEALKKNSEIMLGIYKKIRENFWDLKVSILVSKYKPESNADKLMLYLAKLNYLLKLNTLDKYYHMRKVLKEFFSEFSSYSFKDPLAYVIKYFEKKGDFEISNKLREGRIDNLNSWELEKIARYIVRNASYWREFNRVVIKMHGEEMTVKKYLLMKLKKVNNVEDYYKECGIQDKGTSMA